MRKKIRFYGQHTRQTCGSACMLMLLDYYSKITYPTRKMEQELYSRYHVNGYKGIIGSAVANCLSSPKNALLVHLVQSFSDRMENRGELFTEKEYELLTASYAMHLQACKDRIRFSPAVDFDGAFLMQALRDRKKIILECFIPEFEGEPPSVLHWIILDAFDEETGLFRVRDPNPQVKLLHLTAAELEAYMDTPIGKICILVGDGTEENT